MRKRHPARSGRIRAGLPLHSAENMRHILQGKLTSSKYAKLTRVSQDTAGRDIADLMGQGLLRKEEAGGRSTSYRLVEPK